MSTTARVAISEELVKTAEGTTESLSSLTAPILDYENRVTDSRFASSGRKSSCSPLRSLCCETFNLILSYLDPIEVCNQIRPLSSDFKWFIDYLWFPTSLRVTPKWVEHFEAACSALRRMATLSSTTGRPAMSADLLSQSHKRGAGLLFHSIAYDDVDRPTTGLSGGAIDAGTPTSTRPFEHKSTSAVLVPLCRRPRAAIDSENQSPSGIQAAAERSALSLLRALAQETFLFLSLTDNPEFVPAWFRRCQNRLQYFTYVQNNVLTHRIVNDYESPSSRVNTPRQSAGETPVVSPRACVSHQTPTPRPPPRFYTPSASPISTGGGESVHGVRNQGSPHIDNPLSLLDVLTLLLASSRTIKHFVLETTAHFSSFLQGPAIPRCPVSMTRRACLDSLPSSFCLMSHEAPPRADALPASLSELGSSDSAANEIHWECWSDLLAHILPTHSSDFEQLTTLNLSGSYLPASLAVLASIPNLRFSQLRRLCIKGALVVGRLGLEALEQIASERRPVPPLLSSIRTSSWWIRDLVACLLFAANPFRKLSPGGNASQCSTPTTYWAHALISFFCCHRFPKLETLELRIGCGPLERRVWWCLLLTEIFLSQTLRFLELDCTIESLTCFLPDMCDSLAGGKPVTPRQFTSPHAARHPTGTLSAFLTPRSLASPSVSPGRHRRQCSADSSAHRQSLAITLFSDARRFPSLEVIRVASAYSLSDIVRLEDFISNRLSNRKVVVQVRRLHLFVQAQDFADQCDAYATWPQRRQGDGVSPFPPGADPALTLDFSFAFPAAARRRRLRRPAHPYSISLRTHMIPGIRRLVISRFNPLCPNHCSILAAIRFPESYNVRSRTSLKVVCVRLGLPENLVYYTNKGSTPTWEVPGCLKLARESLWASLNAHPDISVTREIQVVPSPFWLRRV